MEAFQLDLFGTSLPEFKIENKIRLIECFGGIGSQAKALEVLQEYGLLTFEHHRLVEWAAPSIISYNAIHMHDWRDHSEGKTVDELVELTNGISVNYNEPMTAEQRRRKGEKWLRRVYSSMVATHDYCPDVSRVHWSDLAITETDNYTYILTYSFPCTDISLAGKMEGYRKGSGTRSGLLWEIERILLECEEHNCLPQVLIMENVRGVLSDKESFGSWDGALHKMGYTSYVKILNSKNFGIPQNRERVFMVSILGDYAYNFPEPFKRNHNLKDFLDTNVDEKYYLSEEHLQNIANWRSRENPLDAVMGNNTEFSPTITTRVAESIDGGVNASTKLYSPELDNTENLLDKPLVVGNYSKSGNFAQRMVVSDEGICNTVTTGNHGEPTAVQISEKDISNSIRCGGRGSVDRHEWDLVVDTIPIREATKKGYKEAKVGDGIDIATRSENHRGTVQDGMSQTIKTSIDVGVVVEDGGGC